MSQDCPKPNRFALKVELEQTTDLGTLKYGDVVAVIETNLGDPTAIGRMLAYGHVHVCRLAEDEECPQCVGKKIEPAEEEPEEEPEQESEPEAVTDDSEADEPHPLEVLSEFGVDAGTISALKDAKIESIEQLQDKIVAGEKIKGVGDLRVQQITTALDQLEKAGA